MDFYQDISNNSYLTDNTDFRNKAQNFHLNNERTGNSLEQLTELKEFSEYSDLTEEDLSEHEKDVVEGLWDMVDAYGTLVNGPSNYDEHVALGWSINELSQSYHEQTCSDEIAELYQAGTDIARDILEDQIVMQTAEELARSLDQQTTTETTETW